MTDGAAGAGENEDDRGEDYGGLLGAIPFAYRASESRLVRSYVVVGTVLVVFVTALFVQALVVLLGGTGGASGGTFTFSRAFFVLVAMAVVVPLLGPIISVARRHRRGRWERRTDVRMAALGYLFVLTLYLALVISVPPALQSPVEGPHAPVVETLYALPPAVGVAAPLLVAVAMWLVHRRAPA
jgi:polyferredoxin